jgi:hypothetical protein
MDEGGSQHDNQAWAGRENGFPPTLDEARRQAQRPTGR